MYIAGLYERRKVDTSIQHVFYVQGETGPVAQVVYDEVTHSEEKLYIEGDALGSVGVVSNEHGQVVERVFFDPFGKRIAADGTAPSGVPTAVKRGFTGHAHDDELGLIDMNGRVYDAVQRRFLTPDPHVSNPLFGQSYNRYSYVLNSPLRYTDPTGFDPWPTADNCGKPPSSWLTVGTFDLSSKAVDRSKSTGDATPAAAPAKADDAGYTPPTGALAPTKASLGDSPTPGSAVAPAQIAAPSEDASTGGSWKENDWAQGLGGFAVGLGLGVTPFGSVIQHGLTETKMLDQGTRAAQIGRSIGELIGGIGQIVVGGAGGVGGGVISASGFGALFGVPAIVVAEGVVTSGVGSVAAGLAGLGQALSTSGSGTAARGGANAFPRSSLRGISTKWLQRNKPSGWRQVPSDNGQGWKWLDENGIERLRFTRPNGLNPSASQWSRQANGYFRWQNAAGEFLDIDGNVVSKSNPLFNELTHIMYEGL